MVELESKIPGSELFSEVTPTRLSRPKSLLILSNDKYFPIAKTSQSLLSACERLGIPTMLRDSSDVRCLAYLGEVQKQPELIEEAELLLMEKWNAMVSGFHVDTVLSLDLQWLFLPDLFIAHPGIDQIVSLWFDDFRSWAKANAMFPWGSRDFQAVTRHPKVCHCFYGQAIASEARLLGYARQKLSFLAAPSEFLALKHPCEIRDRAAFIGNPGFRALPHEHIIKRMHEGAELDELRRMSRDVTIYGRESKKDIWCKEEPSVFKLLGVAAEARVVNPQFSALQILQMAGTHYPRALDYLNERGDILDVAVLIKMINRYDRPATIWRLYQHGLVDVYSADHEWKPYGISAHPPVLARDLPKFYQKYAVHLNGANCLRDATANEKLFEIAACGRISINLESPDIRLCYGPDEVVYVETLGALEEKARELLREPEKALNMGKRARLRTAREHLWDHRIQALFA